MAVEGEEQLLRALTLLEEDATDRNAHAAGGQLVLTKARKRSRSSRVRATGRVSVGAKKATVIFGSPRVPWAGPSHFGHGAPGRPRPQGGYMLPNPFAWDGADEVRDQVYDLYMTRTGQAIDRYF